MLVAVGTMGSLHVDAGNRLEPQTRLHGDFRSEKLDALAIAERMVAAKSESG